MLQKDFYATLALVSYNDLSPFTNGEHLIEGTKTLILPHTFNPKKPEHVVPTDKNWLILMEHMPGLQKIIFFAGKKASGSLEEIKLFCTVCNTEKLYIVMCDHDLDEKIELLQTYAIPEKQYMYFKDGNLPCKERPILLGLMYDYILNNHR